MRVDMRRVVVFLAVTGAVCLGMAAGSSADDAAGTAPRDSLAAPGDSTAALPDSLQARGIRAAPPDSARRDSVAFEPFDLTLSGNTISGLRGMYALDYGVAGREEIKEFISSNPAEALVMDAGIRYITRGFYGGPQFLSIRGRDPQNTAYMMDGIPVTDPQIEVFDPHWLPIEGTDRIEVIKGPATALFGGGGTGGLVNSVSHDVLIPVPLTRLNVWFGSFGTRLVGASFSRSVGNNFGFIGAYDYFATDGFVDGAGSKLEKLYAKVSARFPSSLKFDVIAYRHVGDTGILGADYTGRLDSRTFLDLSFELGRESVLDLDFYYFDIRETFRAPSGQSSVEEGSLSGASLVWSAAEATSRVRRLGASFKRKNTTSVDDIAEGSAFGEFAYDRGDFGGQAVIRAERNSEHDFQYALSLPMTYALPRGLRLFGRLDRGYTYPLARDAASREGAEITKSISAGILWNTSVLQLSLNVFYYDVNDAEMYRTDDSCVTRLIEGASMEMLGGEFGIYMAPVYGFEATVTLSTGDSNEAAEGESQTQPLSVLAWGIRYRYQFTRHIGTGITFAGRWSSRTSLGHRWECLDEDCTETVCLADASLPAFKSATLYGYLSFDDARVFARVRNVFNESIPISWNKPSLPGRSYEFGLTVDLHD